MFYTSLVMYSPDQKFYSEKDTTNKVFFKCFWSGLAVLSLTNQWVDCSKSTDPTDPFKGCTTFLNNTIKLVDRLISRLRNCDRVGREVSHQPL